MVWCRVLTRGETNRKIQELTLSQSVILSVLQTMQLLRLQLSLAIHLKLPIWPYHVWVRIK